MPANCRLDYPSSSKPENQQGLIAPSLADQNRWNEIDWTEYHQLEGEVAEQKAQFKKKK